jgi:hypothetical protein
MDELRSRVIPMRLLNAHSPSSVTLHRGCVVIVGCVWMHMHAITPPCKLPRVESDPTGRVPGLLPQSLNSSPPP